MSKLNINRNIFLEKEELVRLQKFLGEDNVATQVMLDNTSKWGIVRTAFTGTSPDFLVEVGTNLGTIQIANLSKAVDEDKLLIKQTPIDNVSVPDDSSWYWVKINHSYSPIEEGECTININGEVSGVNTKFLDVLRGQSTDVPVKIKFTNPNSTLQNDQVYEVVDVIDNNNIIVSGASFTAESALKYFVIGSTPIGETLTSSQLEGLYNYDACNLEFVIEEVEDTAPVTGYVENKDFYIARVRNVSGTVTVQDKRGDQFLTFNVEGVADKLDKDPNNWNFDDQTKEDARNAIGAASAEDIQLSFFEDTGWQSMYRGVAASSSNFSIYIRRVGKMVTITGKFTTGGNNSPNAVVASIPFTTIGLSSRTTQRIYFECNDVSDLERNRGMKMYIQEYVTGDSYLYIKVQSAEQTVADMCFTITYIAV